MTRATAILIAFCLTVLGAGSAFATEGDYNGDGSVDAADQQLLLDALGSGPDDPNYLPAGDHDGDGVISTVDVGYFLKIAK